MDSPVLQVVFRHSRSELGTVVREHHQVFWNILWCSKTADEALVEHIINHGGRGHFEGPPGQPVAGTIIQHGNRPLPIRPPRSGSISGLCLKVCPARRVFSDQKDLKVD